MKISVVIPTYNRRALLVRAVSSVLAQTYRDFELIIVDDGSTECLAEVAKTVLDAGHKFIRTECLGRTERGGVSQARNVGVSASSGNWISFLDSDDQWLPEKLARQVAALNRNKEFKFCHCDEIWFRNGKFVNPRKKHQKADRDAFYRSLELCCISPSSVLMEKSFFEDLGGFDETMWVCEDYDLWLRATAREPVLFINEQLVKKYGGHADQLSRSLEAMDRFRVYSLIKLLAVESLSSDQRDAAIKVLVAKSVVLANGAHKRSLNKRGDLYAGLVAKAQKWHFETANIPVSLIAEVRKDLDTNGICAQIAFAHK